MGFTQADYFAMQSRLANKVRQLCAPPPLLNAVKPAKRVRQDTKPLMNKLEQRWFNHLKNNPDVIELRAQSLRFKIANGAWYKPDITCRYKGWQPLNVYECKGPKEMKNIARGILALKCAAAAWPENNFILVWEANGQFRTQQILP